MQSAPGGNLSMRLNSKFSSSAYPISMLKFQDFCIMNYVMMSIHCKKRMLTLITFESKGRENDSNKLFESSSLTLIILSLRDFLYKT